MAKKAGYYEMPSDSDWIGYWDGEKWEPNSYAKQFVIENFRSTGRDIPMFKTHEQFRTESPVIRTDVPQGGEGWYTEPTDSNKVRLWKDGAWDVDAYTKEQMAGFCLNNDIPQPIFDPVAKPAGWYSFADNFLAAYWDGKEWSEYLPASAFMKVLEPKYYLHGGTPGSLTDRNLMSTADVDLEKLLYQRTTVDEVRALDDGSAHEYNAGPGWVRDPANPRLARRWDGEAYTEEVELIGVLQQREHDEKADGAPQTVSNAPVTAETEAGVWYSDPEDAASMIRWGGARWDRRKSVQQMIADLFAQLNEEVPAEWAQHATLTERHTELIRQLHARINGEAGWYKEPGRFDDLFMRYWADGTWTEHTSAQPAGWFSDPWDDELIRYWSGASWAGQTRNKAVQQRNEERAAATLNIAKQAGLYLGLKAAESVVWRFSRERRNQIVAAGRADYSQNLRDEAARQQAKFYRDRQSKRLF